MSEAAIRAAFREQATACRKLGSPFTAALCDALAELLHPDQGAVATRVLTWPGDASGRADSLPLRLCGALHGLVLDGSAPDLAAAYRARQVDDRVVLAALSAYERRVLDWLSSPPQTNEVARSAVIIAAARFLSARCPLPIRALELGASAGLNLNFAHYRLMSKGEIRDGTAAPSPREVWLTPDWAGAMPAPGFSVAERRGVDLRPLDPGRDGLRLMAYCWADQDQRLARLRAALAMARSHPPQVDAADAGDWLAAHLSARATDRLTLVFHTVAAQYFPSATLAACEDALCRAGAAATADAPLGHFAMESDGGDGARLTMRLWDGHNHAWDLGRADFHGRWVNWNPRPIRGLGLGQSSG